MSKKTIIKIVIVAVVLLVGAAVLSIIFNKGGDKPDIDIEESKYSYSMEYQDNNLVVSLDKKIPDGYSWVYFLSDETIAGAEYKTNKLTVTPRNSGDAILTISLEKNGEFLPDRLFVISIYLQVESDLKIKVTSAYSYETKVVYDNNADIPYAFVDTQSESMQIVIGCDNPDNIICENKSDIVVVKAAATEKSVVYYVNASKAGEYDVVFGNQNNKKGVRFTFKVDENQKISVLYHSVEEFDVVKKEIDNKIDESEKNIGEIKIPDGYTITDVSNTTIGEDKHVTQFFLSKGDANYYFVVSSDMKADELRKLFEKKSVTDEKSIKVNGLDGKSYMCGSNNYILWTTTNASSCIVYSEASDVSELADLLSKANPTPSSQKQ